VKVFEASFKSLAILVLANLSAQIPGCHSILQGRFLLDSKARPAPCCTRQNGCHRLPCCPAYLWAGKLSWWHAKGEAILHGRKFACIR
jgi:hypothetical protein